MIFRMADVYNTTIDEGGGEKAYGTLLNFLDTYCRDHFSFEEGCMEEHRCPVAQKNKDAHVMFLATLNDYQQRYQANGYRETDARELIMTTDWWLKEHITGIDIHLRNCVKE